MRVVAVESRLSETTVWWRFQLQTGGLEVHSFRRVWPVSSASELHLHSTVYVPDVPGRAKANPLSHRNESSCILN